MRLIGLPPAILLLGFLAALPFRRESAPEAGGQALGGPSSLPNNVSPIIENAPEHGNTDSLGMKRTLDARFDLRSSDLNQNSPNPYELSVERLPQSYEEVAVPLILDGRAPNLLSLAPVSVPATTDIHHNSAVDRFGIPRSNANGTSSQNGSNGTPWNGLNASSGMRPPVSTMLSNQTPDRGGWSGGKSIEEFAGTPFAEAAMDASTVEGAEKEGQSEETLALSIQVTSRPRVIPSGIRSSKEVSSPVESNVGAYTVEGSSKVSTPAQVSATPSQYPSKKRHLIREPHP